MGKVNFLYADRTFKTGNKRVIKKHVETLFVKEDKRLELLSYIFCSDEYLLKINQDFLKHDDYTDIITFDLTADISHGITGEIYISIDRVKENAKLHASSFFQELTRVILHGALHLCGYKDKKKSEITIMRQKEDFYLHLLQHA